jgi:stage IV sporulation protein FB
MARRFGVRTPDVILLPIGGVARLERMPERPSQELLVALAGPAVTLALAVVFYFWLRATGVVPSLVPSLTIEGTSMLDDLYRINVVLLLFNLIPAFPMDGGRVLRALLASRMGLPRATRVAASVGQILAFALGFAALMSGNMLLLLIAFFVFLGAGAEAAAVETRAAGAGLTVREMMVTDFRTLPSWATLRDAAELLVASDQREFPIVDNGGEVEGILTRDDLVRGLSQKGPDALARTAVHAPSPPVLAGLAFDAARAALQASGRSALPVIENGRLIGMLTKDNITDLVLVRRAVAR